ncbi:MAG: hypothetical protein P4L36_07425 [Holophaga sp.]|nr:hypothetical protein [Holophaga sp.]
MLLSHLVMVLVVVGVLLWLINTYIPMQSTIKRIINVVVIICVIFWVLSAFGFMSEFQHVRVGNGRHW